MLQAFNKRLEKLMPFITPTAVLIGVVFANHLASFTYIVPWVFAFMTFSGSLSSNFYSLQRAFKYPLPLLTALFILHIVMPLWAFGIGSLVFPQDSLTVTGLLLAMVIPTGITSFVWVSIYKGNIGLALSIILIDTVLSPFIVPTSLSIFVGQKVEMDVWVIMNGLLFMVVIPSLIGMLCNQLSKGKVKDTIGVHLSPFAKIGIGVVVAINSSAVAPYLKNINSKLIFIAGTVLFIALSGFTIAWLLATLLKQNRETKASLLFTGGMRNISAGAVIAVQYFPASVAVPVVVGMLFQQILASFFGYLFHRREMKTFQEV